MSICGRHGTRNNNLSCTVKVSYKNVLFVAAVRMDTSEDDANGNLGHAENQKTM